MYYIYVAQPLANSSDSPSDVYFNIYMSLGEDFTFHGYSTELADASGPYRYNTVLPTVIKRDKKSIHKFTFMEKEEDSVVEHLKEKNALTIDKNKEAQDKNAKVTVYHTSEEALSAKLIEIADKKDEKEKELEKAKSDKKIEPKNKKDIYKPQSYTSESTRAKRKKTAKRISRIVNCLCACIDAWKEHDECDIVYKPQGQEVMNQPQKQETESDGKINLTTDTRIQPLVDVRPLIRRLYPTEVVSVPLNTTQASAIAIVLNRYLGENTDRLATPSISISRMYYGKEAGIKMRVRMRMRSGTLPFLNAKFYYVPPQYYPKIDVGAESVLGGSSAAFNEGFVADYAQYPLNNVTVHALDSYHYIYEFTIPNTSLFKFVGGPRKMLFVGPSPDYYLASADMGHLVITVDSPVAAAVNMFLEASLTDETRLGFHSIAPVIIRKTQATTPVSWLTSTTGSVNGSAAYPPVGLNGFVYATRS